MPCSGLCCAGQVALAGQRLASSTPSPRRPGVDQVAPRYHDRADGVQTNPVFSPDTDRLSPPTRLLPRGSFRGGAPVLRASTRSRFSQSGRHTRSARAVFLLDEQLRSRTAGSRTRAGRRTRSTWPPKSASRSGESHRCRKGTTGTRAPSSHLRSSLPSSKRGCSAAHAGPLGVTPFVRPRAGEAGGGIVETGGSYCTGRGRDRRNAVQHLLARGRSGPEHPPTCLVRSSGLCTGRALNDDGIKGSFLMLNHGTSRKSRLLSRAPHQVLNWLRLQGFCRTRGNRG